jgi:hypothetical protein
MDESNNFSYEWGNLSRYKVILLLSANYCSNPYVPPFALFFETNVWYTCILNSYIFPFYIRLFQIKYICYKYNHIKSPYSTKKYNFVRIH